jgi:hypothetical protein
MAAVERRALPVGRPPWLVVADRELRDLWLAGRGLPLMFVYALLLSVTSYLVATNQALNFLEQREAASLTLQVAVAVGALLVLLGAADAVSGERERGTLESLLLSPAPRRALVAGKALAALSLWAAPPGCCRSPTSGTWATGSASAGWRSPAACWSAACWPCSWPATGCWSAPWPGPTG